MAPQRTPLAAETLANDPRFRKGKEFLLAALQDHTEKITAVSPPSEERAISYDAVIQAFATHRGSPLFYPYVGSGIGNGALVELLDGSIKYDMIGGIGVHFFGHSHPGLTEISLNAAMSDTIMQGNLQQNEDSLALMELLVRTSGLDHCFLTTSGVMANENALKMAFQKRQPARRILAFTHCFAGRTITFAQVTDKPAYRQGLPHTVSVDYVPFYDGSDPAFSLEHSLAILRAHIARYPGEHAAMIFELVQGEGGCYPGTHAFFSALMEECRKNRIAIIVDEVQTFGRTPSLFAFHHFGLAPYVDFVTIGKLSQVCATLYRKEYVPQPGLISQTFTGSTVAIQAGRWIIETLLTGGYYGPEGKIVRMHHYFRDHLEEIAKKIPAPLEGPYGLGGMMAFTPLGGDKKRVLHFARALFAAGVIGFTAGQNPTRMRFLLPLGVLTEYDIDQVALLIETVLRKSHS